MNTKRQSGGLHVTRYAGHEGDDGTLRIEHDRRRLLLTALASAFAAVTTSAALVVTLAHLDRLPEALLRAPNLDPEFVTWASSIPAWAPVAVGVAALLAVLRMLRNFYRLQDSDPAFILSPRDLRFKPGVFGESVRVPWTSIRAVTARRHGKHRSIVLQVDDLDRYVPRSGLFAALRPPGDKLVLRQPLSRASLDELVGLLQTHLDRYGKSRAKAEAGKAVPKIAAANPSAGTTAG